MFGRLSNTYRNLDNKARSFSNSKCCHHLWRFIKIWKWKSHYNTTFPFVSIKTISQVSSHTNKKVSAEIVSVFHSVYYNSVLSLELMDT